MVSIFQLFWHEIILKCKLPIVVKTKSDTIPEILLPLHYFKTYCVTVEKT